MMRINDGQVGAPAIETLPRYAAVVTNCAYDTCMFIKKGLNGG